MREPHEIAEDNASKRDEIAAKLKAASAMLAALEECVRYLDDLTGDMGDCPAPSDGWCSKLCETYGCMGMRSEQARTAIKQAKAAGLTSEGR